MFDTLGSLRANCVLLFQVAKTLRTECVSGSVPRNSAVYNYPGTNEIHPTVIQVSTDTLKK